MRSCSFGLAHRAPCGRGISVRARAAESPAMPNLLDIEPPELFDPVDSLTTGDESEFCGMKGAHLNRAFSRTGASVCANAPSVPGISPRTSLPWMSIAELTLLSISGCRHVFQRLRHNATPPCTNSTATRQNKRACQHDSTSTHTILSCIRSRSFG